MKRRCSRACLLLPNVLLQALMPPLLLLLLQCVKVNQESEVSPTQTPAPVLGPHHALHIQEVGLNVCQLVL